MTARWVRRPIATFAVAFLSIMLVGEVHVAAATAAAGTGASARILHPHATGLAGFPLCPVINNTTITTPYVTSVTPSFGPASGNTTITVIGFNFQGCESDGNASTSTSNGVTTTTIPVTTYSFSVYGVELDSTTLPAIKEGSQTVKTISNTQVQALTPPGPLCTLTTAMDVIVDALVVSQSYNFVSINGGPFVAQASAPPSKPSTTSSPILIPPVLFTYQNEGPQVIACNKTGIPYDLADGNAVVRQMANELSGDINTERTFRGLSALRPNSYLQVVAEFWANQMANGGGQASASAGQATVTSYDGCILPEVAASGYRYTGALWAAENAGGFASTANTGMMNAAFVTSTGPEAETTTSVNGGAIGGSACAGATGQTVAQTSTAHNMFATTFTDMGVAVACTGATGGSCFAAEVFAGTNPVQPDCADITPTQPQSTCGKAQISGGGTQALDVLPAAPENVTASLEQVPGGAYQITASWSPPAAQGFDPVNMYAFELTDTFSGQFCANDQGAGVVSDQIIGCIVSGSIIPVTADAYQVSVRAVNDLCSAQSLAACFPEALYPAPPSPLLGSPCASYGSAFYPWCTPDASSPDGPWQFATPNPVELSGPTCNPNTVAGNGQCNPPPKEQGMGYRLVAPDGGVFAYGGAGFYGSMGATKLNAPMVGIAGTPDGGGYWSVASDGGIFTFGDARFFGSTGGTRLSAPVTAMAVTPDGGGYWLVGTDGGIFAFGDATYFGSPTQGGTNKCGAAGVSGQVQAMAVTPDGGGYWLVDGKGQVLAYGDASCLGQAPGKSKFPVVGITPTADGAGYWLADANGDVFSFGDAVAFGNATGSAKTSPVLAIAATSDGKGYWLLATGGYIDSYGDATFSGSPSNLVGKLSTNHWPVAMEVG